MSRVDNMKKKKRVVQVLLNKLLEKGIFDLYILFINKQMNFV